MIKVCSGMGLIFELLQLPLAAAASALVGNIGWFIGMLVALVLLIILVVLAYVVIKSGYEMGGTGTTRTEGRYPEATYTGISKSISPVLSLQLAWCKSSL